MKWTSKQRLGKVHADKEAAIEILGISTYKE